MADRRCQIEWLLASRYDGLFLPSGALMTRAGLVPAERMPCMVCGGVLIRDDFGKVIRRRKGRGWILDGFRRRQPCAACGGYQDDRGRWHGGELARDPMDAQGVRVGSSSTVATARPRRTVLCDACDRGVRAGTACGYCGGTGRRDLHAFELTLDTRDPDERDPLLEAIEQRDRSGSYRELEQALAGIRVHVNKPARFAWLTANATWALRLLDEVTLGIRPITDLSSGERSLYDLAIAYIDQRMPTPIRVPVDVRLNAREHAEHRKRVKGRRASNGAVRARDDEIRRLIRRGTPTQRVAFDFGLSVSQVNRIVDGGSAEEVAA